MTMKRRNMIRSVAVGSFTLFFVPALLSSCEKDQPEPDGNNGNPDDGGGNDGGNSLVIDLTDPDYGALTAAGGSMVIDEIIIVNTGDGFVALSSVCTHLGCQVTYNQSSGNLPCPCHGSVFSITGSVLNGPASSPLEQYNVTQEGDILTIAL
jgi:cytochrome b6-f complex iron-sulfur subunit